jgi:hypothetical protein
MQRICAIGSFSQAERVLAVVSRSAASHQLMNNWSSASPCQPGFRQNTILSYLFHGNMLNAKAVPDILATTLPLPLPMELILQIFDHLLPDNDAVDMSETIYFYPTFAALARTCRLFRPIATQYMHTLCVTCASRSIDRQPRGTKWLMIVRKRGTYQIPPPDGLC